MPSLGRLSLPVSLVAVSSGVLGGAVFLLAASCSSPKMALLAVCGLGGILVILRFPMVGFYLTLAVVPLERLGRFTSDTSTFTISVMRLLGLATAAGFLIHLCVRRWRPAFGAPFLIHLVYVGLAFLSLLYSDDTEASIRALGPITGNVLFLFLVVNMARDWRTVKVAVALWLSFTILMGLYTIYGWHFGSGVMDALDIGQHENRFTVVETDHTEYEIARVNRATGPTSHPAVWGINLLLTIPFFGFLLRTRLSPVRSALTYAGFGVILYNILLTNTRAPLLVAAGVVLLCFLRRLLVITPARISAAIVCVALVVPAISETIFTRVLDPGNYSYRGSAALRIRIEYWKAGRDILGEHWLTGMGIGFTGIPDYVRGTVPEQSSVHNEFLQNLIELGVFGALSFYLFLGVLLWCAFRGASLARGLPGREEQYWFLVACQIAMIAALAYGLQCDVFHFPLKGWWLIAGLAWNVHESLRSAGSGTQQPVSRSLADALSPWRPAPAT